MARFAPNLHHQFLELPSAERFAAAAKLGFDAVEWHFPYELSKSELKARLRDAEQRFIYAVTPSDWAGGNFGLAGQPDQVAEFRRTAEIGLDYALEIGFRSLQVAPGSLPVDAERARYVDTLLENLHWLRERIHGTPLLLCLEGVCDARFPGKRFVLRTMQDAADIVTTIGQANVRVVYDTFHLRMQEQGSLSQILDRFFPLIGHVQIGNAPIRHEPGVGEIDLHFLIEQLDRKGYEGWIGLEYDPSGDTWSSLAWAARYGYRVGDHQAAA